jgi:hypothetical protein
MRLLRNASTVCRATFIAVLAALMISCTRERVRTPYVARVDGAELTPTQLAAMCDTLGNGRQQARAYINDWIVTELLYQEAVRRGIADGEDIRRQVEAARRHLAISALLDRELGTNDTLLAPEAAVKAYFDTSAGAFALRDEVVNASYALFSERDAANVFRSRVLRGTQWIEAIQQARRDSASHAQLLQVADHQYFTHATLYPEELWKLARTLRKDEVTFVVKTNSGYYVMQVHSIKRQGEPPDFAYVRDEVRTRLLIATRRARYEQLVRNLRDRHAIEVLLDSASRTEGSSG